MVSISFHSPDFFVRKRLPNYCGGVDEEQER